MLVVGKACVAMFRPVSGFKGRTFVMFFIYTRNKLLVVEKHVRLCSDPLQASKGEHLSRYLFRTRNKVLVVGKACVAMF